MLWFGLEGECELMIGCARSVKTFTRTAERANEYGLGIVLLATSEFSMAELQFTDSFVACTDVTSRACHTRREDRTF